MKILFFTMLACCWSATAAELKVNVVMHVRDETGQPIADAKTLIVISKAGPHEDVDDLVRLTQSDGSVTMSGRVEDEHLFMGIRVMADHPDYYTSELELPPVIIPQYDVNVVMRKKITPIPLHAKHLRENIPGFGVPYGFDLELGEWVAPHGAGRNADMIFKVDKIVGPDGKDGGRLAVTFSHGGGVCVKDEKSGYLGISEMKMPHLADERGYVPILEKFNYGGDDWLVKHGLGYFIKVLRPDEKGDLQVYYAKINDDLAFGISGGKFLPESMRDVSSNEYAFIRFTYYFNPTPDDRNLEFDQKTNLLRKKTDSYENFDP